MAGHIKLDRKILTWEWYQDANTCRLFIHLLLTANHKDGRWQGHNIGRGQLITGLLKLNEDTGLTIRELRTSFDKLKMTGEITIKTTNKFRLVTICKYDTYQSIKNENDNQNDNQIDKRPTSDRQTNDKQATTNNNEKNNKEGKEIYTSVPEKIFATIMGLGTMEISILNNCGGWQIKHLSEFISKSDKEFEIMAMNKPELRKIENFQDLLQDFVNRIQEGDEYKETGALKRHFKNWVNEKNGTLELYLKNLRNKNATPKITANSFI